MEELRALLEELEGNLARLGLRRWIFAALARNYAVRKADGELEQIQLLLRHASIRTVRGVLPRDFPFLPST